VFLDLRILNGLRDHFAEVRILKALGLDSRLALGP